MHDTNTLPNSYQYAHKILKRIVALVTIYGAGMVVAGNEFAIPLFDAFRFGPKSRGLNDDGVKYSLFTFGVLGAVLVGWMVLIISMVDLAAYEGDPTVRAMARRGLMLSVATWFLFDTGFSLASGEIEHAIFNIPFGTLIGLPLYIMHTNENGRKNLGKRKA
jgi:hypothetical protein